MSKYTDRQKSRTRFFCQIYQKHAIFTPLLKKSGLDPNELKNFRPVSNLPFVSKILAKVVQKQLLTHLSDKKTKNYRLCACVCVVFVFHICLPKPEEESMPLALPWSLSISLSGGTWVTETRSRSCWMLEVERSTPCIACHHPWRHKMWSVVNLEHQTSLSKLTF